MARAVPAVEDHVLVGQLLGHVAPEVLVGDEQDVVLGEPRADRDRVGRGHADVAPHLYLGGGVDVAHHGEVVAVLGARGVDVCAAHHVRHGAVGRRLGEQHALVRVEQLGRLAHELDAGEHDGALRQVDGEARQGKRVAHVVGEGLNLGWHVVVEWARITASRSALRRSIPSRTAAGTSGAEASCDAPSGRGLRRGHLDAVVAPPSSPVVAAGRAPPGFSVLRSSAIGLSRLSCGHLLPAPRDSIALAVAADKTGVKMPSRAQLSRAGGARVPCRYVCGVGEGARASRRSICKQDVSRPVSDARFACRRVRLCLYSFLGGGYSFSATLAV